MSEVKASWRTPDLTSKYKKAYTVCVADAEGNQTEHHLDCYSVMSVAGWASYALVPKGGRIVAAYETDHKIDISIPISS